MGTKYEKNNLINYIYKQIKNAKSLEILRKIELMKKIDFVFALLFLTQYDRMRI